MHPHMGCEKGFDKLGVTIECVAQDLESTNSESEIEEPAVLHGSFNSSGGLTITEVTDSIADCSVPSANHFPSSASAGATITTSSITPSVSNFSAMANFNNGFTFPSPAVVATMSSSCSPYSIGQNVALWCPTSTASSSNIQFPTPSASGLRRYPVVPVSDCTSVSASWGFPTNAQPPMSFSGMPSRVQHFDPADRPTKFRSKLSKKNWKPASSMCTVHGKRKADLDPYDADQGRKIRINEDRMAARMQDLHLDNNNLEWHPNMEDDPWYAEAPPPTVNNNEPDDLSISDIELDSEEYEDSPPKCSRLPRLELAQELCVNLKSREILPQVFMEELKKPSMQLVLWKPPGSILDEMVKDNKPLPDPAARSSSSSSRLNCMEMEDACAATSSKADPPQTTWPGNGVTLNGARSPEAIFDSVDDDMDL